MKQQKLSFTVGTYRWTIIGRFFGTCVHLWITLTSVPRADAGWKKKCSILRYNTLNRKFSQKYNIFKSHNLQQCYIIHFSSKTFKLFQTHHLQNLTCKRETGQRGLLKRKKVFGMLPDRMNYLPTTVTRECKIHELHEYSIKYLKKLYKI